MRFITQFELEYPYTLTAPELCIERAERQMGKMIEDSFTRKEKEVLIRGNEGRRWSLEIEAFPMDKWIEFKKRVADALPDYDVVSRTRIINAFIDLESLNLKQQKEE